MDWVRKWMLEKYSLPFNETDIYSARCGLLHAQITEPDQIHFRVFTKRINCKAENAVYY